MLTSLLSFLLATSGPQDRQVDDLRYDQRGRPVIAVQVNDQGPFPMILDSGAQSSLLSPALADQLHLPAMDSDMRIVGATATIAAKLYPVDHFASHLFDARAVALFQFPHAGANAAPGIVGMEVFSGRKLVIDRVAHQVVAGASGLSPGFVALKGTLGAHGLLEVPLVINGVTIDALVDTGSAATIGNAAALHALGWQKDDARLAPAGEIRDAANADQGVRVATMDTVKIGPATLHKVKLYFTPTEREGDTAPHLILGSDLLDQFEAFALDFPRAELQIRLPTKPAAPAP